MVSSPGKFITPSYNSDLIFTTEETVQPNLYRVESLKSDLKNLREQSISQERDLHFLRDLTTKLEVHKFLSGCEMLRLVKNNSSIKRQMQGMEDTINGLRMENKALKEGHEKLQILLNNQEYQSMSEKSSKSQEDEIQKLRKRVQTLQQNLADINQNNVQNQGKIEGSAVKTLRENAVFIAEMLVSTYEQVESQILGLMPSEQDQGQTGAQLNSKMEELRSCCKNLSQHKSNLVLIKDSIK